MSASLKVVFLPFWTRESPYQAELARALGALGVEVEGIDAGTPLLRMAWRTRPDVLHLHWLSPLYRGPHRIRNGLKLVSFAARLALLRGTGIRIVWTAHNLTAHEAPDSRLERLFAAIVARLAHAVIVHGETARDLLAAELRLRSTAKIAVIPHGSYLGVYPDEVDRASARRRLDLRPDDFVYLSLGQIRPYKGLLELVRSFRRLEHPRARLLITGRPSTAAVEQALRSETAGEERIRFLPGFVPDDELQLYFRAADVSVLPYENILTSGSLVLAMSFGLACLSPRVGCIPDYLEERGGFLYDPSEPDALRKTLEEAFREGDGVVQMGAFNRKKAETLGWARIAAQTLEVYAGRRHTGTARQAAME